MSRRRSCSTRRRSGKRSARCHGRGLGTTPPGRHSLCCLRRRQPARALFAYASSGMLLIQWRQNNLRLEGTFMNVDQQQAGGAFAAVRSDSHPSTRFQWARTSTILGTSSVNTSWCAVGASVRALARPWRCTCSRTGGCAGRSRQARLQGRTASHTLGTRREFLGGSRRSRAIRARSPSLRRGSEPQAARLRMYKVFIDNIQ